MIYNGTEPVRRLSPVKGNLGTDINILSYDPGILLVWDGEFFTARSISRDEEFIRMESDGDALYASTVSEESNGKPYIVAGSRYLIDTESWSVVHDFGRRDVTAHTSVFYFNEHLGLWGITGIRGTFSNMIFFDPDTFEEVFSTSLFWAASPDGKYIYTVCSFIDGHLCIQIPLLDEDELIERISGILSNFGITEEMLESGNIYG